MCSDPLWQAIRGISDQQQEDNLDDSPSLPGGDQVSAYQAMATERAIVSDSVRAGGLVFTQVFFI